MKLLLMLVFTISLNAATQYKSPAYEVSAELYCSSIDGTNIITKQKGDILLSDYASYYCSYNKDSMNEIMSKVSDEYKSSLETLLVVLGIIILSIALTPVLLLGIITLFRKI